MTRYFAFGNNAFGNIDPDLSLYNQKSIIKSPHELRFNEWTNACRGQSNPVHSGDAAGRTKCDPGITMKGIHICQPSWSNLFFIESDGSLYVQGLKGNECGKGEILPHHAKSVCSSWDRTYVVCDKGDHKILVYTGSTWIDYTEVQKVNMPPKSNDQETIRFLQVSSGEHHTVTITDSGQVFHIEKDAEQNFICRPLTLHFKIKAVSCGKEHILLLSRIGTVFSYGLGSRGQLGNGTANKEDFPKVVEALEGISVTQVAAGGWHSCAISDMGDLYIWGWNESGQLGFPSKVVRQSWDNFQDVYEPEKRDNSTEYVNLQTIPRLLDLTSDENMLITAASCGSRHTAAVTGDGQLYTWGWNAYGQLGLGDDLPRDNPCSVNMSDLFVQDVVCGFWNTVITTTSRSCHLEDSSEVSVSVDRVT